MAGLFSGDLFKKRLDPDYFSHSQEYLMEAIGGMAAGGAFWQMPG
jgi:hypothetical protein